MIKIVFSGDLTVARSLIAALDHDNVTQAYILNFGEEKVALEFSFHDVNDPKQNILDAHVHDGISIACCNPRDALSKAKNIKFITYIPPLNEMNATQKNAYALSSKNTVFAYKDARTPADERDFLLAKTAFAGLNEFNGLRCEQTDLTKESVTAFLTKVVKRCLDFSKTLKEHHLLAEKLERSSIVFRREHQGLFTESPESSPSPPHPVASNNSLPSRNGASLRELFGELSDNLGSLTSTMEALAASTLEHLPTDDRVRVQTEVAAFENRVNMHVLVSKELQQEYQLPNREQPSLEKGLRNAAANGRYADLKVFIANVYDINAQDSTGLKRTALHWTAIKNKPECYTLLLKAGADPNILDGEGKKALDYLANALSQPVMRKTIPS